VKVKILEIDSERRRLSLSVKRVEGQVLEPKVLPPEELEALSDGDDGEHEQGAGDLDDVPQLGLSEEVFAGDPAAAEPAEAIAGTDAEAGVDEAVAVPVASDEAAGEVAAAPEAAAAEEPEAIEPDADAPDAAQPEAGEPAAS
ncbi:MAG: small subunit ribosomal protein, partial [Solirubrobacteraceae bacterium]|nr:small subunit ribosomal protein [Solirubrobacteraceae bacterium]